jgi:hypothetical protein
MSSGVDGELRNTVIAEEVHGAGEFPSGLAHGATSEGVAAFNLLHILDFFIEYHCEDAQYTWSADDATKRHFLL